MFYIYQFIHFYQMDLFPNLYTVHKNPYDIHDYIKDFDNKVIDNYKKINENFRFWEKSRQMYSITGDCLQENLDRTLQSIEFLKNIDIECNNIIKLVCPESNIYNTIKDIQYMNKCSMVKLDTIIDTIKNDTYIYTPLLPVKYVILFVVMLYIFNIYNNNK